MIRALFQISRNLLNMEFPPEKFKEALRNKKGLLWVDFSGEPPEVCEPILREVFGFHPLAVEDALQQIHTPKLDDWGEYLYIVLGALEYVQDELVTHELDVFLGMNFVVTHHDDPIVALDAVWEACRRDSRHTENGADHLLYRIADYVVAGSMDIVEQVDEKIDGVEAEILNKPNPSVLEQLFDLKRVLLTMRRTITHQREVLNKLARDDYRMVDPMDRVFFRDVYDHLVRLQDLNESMRDLVSGALDIYLSVINNRLNDVMKALTAVTTLFMPISFITGFFGMNFFEPTAHLVEWTSRPSFYIILAIFILLPMTMYLWMRRRTWV
jgi:magnesium transporter